ncbi:VOC family protein [Aeromicrobium terrae]|uniref:VOC family protein n=1 Tax=Aeromicrobium terrae TaxID=2498846 RepID=A0A5C8NHQ6_9ACTN|nr:VOC family protein [Aeromicrobium terrae]TXL61359.1 VOC family protein [Aeromicrobium terrae]
MAIERMDNVGIVVEDLDETIAFFTELGMELEGRMVVEGDWAETAVGVRDMTCEIAMMKLPDGPGRLELCTYHSPDMVRPGPPVPNTVGFHRVMFAVHDLDDTIERLQALGGELLDGVGDYQGAIRICYLRGPSGVVIGLADDVG